jgi:hypothetical protein
MMRRCPYVGRYIGTLARQHFEGMTVAENRSVRSHTRALDYRAIPAHMALLRATEGVPERMAEFFILSAVRTRPIIRCAGVKSISGRRHGTSLTTHEESKEHHGMPLSDRALEILRQQGPANAKPDDLVWPCEITGRLRASITMLRVLRLPGYAAGEVAQHGFRKSFANWRAELRET